MSFLPPRLLCTFAQTSRGKGKGPRLATGQNRARAATWFYPQGCFKQSLPCHNREPSRISLARRSWLLDLGSGKVGSPVARREDVDGGTRVPRNELKQIGGGNEDLFHEGATNGPHLQKKFCPARETVLLETAACRLAGMERGVPLGCTWGSCANACAASKSGGGGCAMEGTSFCCGASCATAPSSRCFDGSTSGTSSRVEEDVPVRGRQGGRREFVTCAGAPSTGTLEGVLASDADALGHGSLDGLSGVELALLAAALNAGNNAACPELDGTNEMVVSNG